VIVVDTNVLSYLLLHGPQTEEAERVYARDARWAAPLLWRSEFRNVLVSYLRRRIFVLEEALTHIQDAEGLLAGQTFDVSSERVLSLAATSECTTYDRECVALGQDLRVPLVTSDEEVLSKFMSIAVSMRAFGA